MDIACGDNCVVLKYGSATGVDISNHRGDEHIITVSTLSGLPIESWSFDTVTIVASLNYFDQQTAVLMEAKRVLNDNGRIIVTMPNHVIMKIWHKVREPWAKQSGFSEAEITAMLHEAGFKTPTRERFLLGLNALYLATK